MFEELFKKQDEGFTLVEIIIVLAIVGLIFVIIFLAVSSAQKGQRDRARSDTVNRLFATVQQALGNGQTVTPANCSAVCASINVGGTVFAIINPINQVAISCPGPWSTSVLCWIPGASCPPQYHTAGGGNGEIYILLESGSNTFACQDY